MTHRRKWSTIRWITAALALTGTAACGGDDGAGEHGVGDASDGPPTLPDASAPLDPEAPLPAPRFGMVAVPPGPFFMGCDPAVDSGCRDDERPGRLVAIWEFQIDAYEVTNEQFAAFLNDYDDGSNKCATLDCYQFDAPDAQMTKQGGSFVPVPGRANYPANQVTWFGAREFCAWADKRLCTEAEWEKAARGGCELYADCAADTPIYPWGNEPWTCDHAVGKDCGIGVAQPTGSKPSGVSPYGAYDMAGNVWEWTADIYAVNYYAVGPNVNPQGADGGDFRVVRGGSFASDEGLRSAYRGAFAFPFITASTVGLRCCADL